MDIGFAAPDLRQLDSLRCETLATPFFEDERPLRGALGLVDWRMCGLISRLILRGRLSGRAGEIVLVATRPRLAFEKLFLFGLGPQCVLDDASLRRAIGGMLDTLTRVRVRVSAMVLPGRALGIVSPGAAVEAFLGATGERREHDRITLVDGPEAHKEMLPIVERERRRARAALA